MKELVFAPIAVAALLGMITELQDLAQDSQDRTLQYTQDVVDALDCAYQARPLTDCAPGITNDDFTQQIQETNNLLRKAQKQTQELQETS